MKRCAWCCALSVVVGAVGCDSDATLVKGPYLQNVTTDGATVMWETDEAATGLVEYGPAGQWTGRAKGKRGRRIHEVRLTELQPEAAYQYQVVVGQAKIGPFEFRTAVKPATPYRFAVYGDNRTNPKVHAAIAQAMARHRPAFVINTGDLVGDGNEYDQWGPQYFEPLAEFHRSVPVYPAIGNHERNGEFYRRFFALPDPEWYYAFAYGNAKFVMIDSCFREANWFSPDSEQGRWLVRQLEDRGHTWTVAVFHHPPYSSHPKRGNSRAHQKLLCPALEKHGVDVVFNGHNHNYERIYPMRGGLRDDDGGVHYVVTGGGGAPIYPALNAWNTAVYEGVHHYCIVEVDGPWLTLTAYAVDGHVIDRFGLCKDPVRLARLADEAKRSTGADRAKAVDRLSVIFSPQMPELLAPFAADPDLAVRRSVAAGLGRLAMAAGRATARKMLADPDPAVRAGAALALVRTAGPEDTATLTRLLKDPDTGVRRSAAWFFIHVHGPELIESVVVALGDRDVSVRRLALRGIQGVTDESVRPVLAKAIADADGDVALEAVGLAVQGRHVAALTGSLGKGVRHQDSRVRYASIKALVSAGQPETLIPMLIEAVADVDARVQGLVVGVLERLSGKTLGYEQALWKKWRDGQGR